MLKRLHNAAPRLVTALFAGIAFTTLMGWWCELRPINNSVFDVSSNVPVPSDLTSHNRPMTASYYHRSGATGRVHEWYDDVKVYRAGWPFLALRGLDGPADVRTMLPSTIFLPDTAAVPAFARGHALPLRPIPLGFAADTLAYGTLAWMVIGLLNRLRGRIRTFRARCAACGYPRQPGSPRCTECGHST